MILVAISDAFVAKWKKKQMQFEAVLLFLPLLWSLLR
jgi:hypothetical protein